MILKGISTENITDYKKICLYLAFPHCSFKCDKEAGCNVCQNSALASSANIEINEDKIIDNYIKNDLTSAIVFGGLEPFDDVDQLFSFIKKLREKTNDEVVIYTGYTKEELSQMGYINQLKNYPNIIIKFGRFIPNQEKHFDEILGVSLASLNQYAERIS